MVQDLKFGPDLFSIICSTIRLSDAALVSPWRGQLQGLSAGSRDPMSTVGETSFRKALCRGNNYSAGGMR